MILLSIKDVQQALKNLGFDPKGIDGIAGPNTYSAVKALQQKHGLLEDGIIDWEVLIILFPSYPWSVILAERAMQIMCTQVGVREETGPNNGIEVRAYLKAVNLGPGYSYCMALVVWSFDQAAKSLNTVNPLVRTGGCLDQLKRTFCPVILSKDYTDPRPGDIGILDLGEGHGHTYMVISGAGAVVNTVEGNTNDDGSSNGNGDYFRQRQIKSAKAFIRVN